MRLLAIDLDQTLLRSDKTISSYSEDIFRCVSHREDIKVIAATGRSVMRAKEYMDAICADGIISLNGAKTLYQNRMISEYGVDETKAVALIRMLLEIPDTYVNVTYPDVILTNNSSLVTGDHIHEYSDYETIQTKEIQKVSITSGHPEIIRQTDFTIYDCKLIDNSKDPRYFAILNQKVSKLTGLLDLCHELHIEQADVIAFGDDYNDLDILQYAGISVAVANAPKEIQAAAKEVCPSNEEDGVARWVETHLLTRA